MNFDTEQNCFIFNQIIKKLADSSQLLNYAHFDKRMSASNV